MACRTPSACVLSPSPLPHPSPSPPSSKSIVFLPKRFKGSPFRPLEVAAASSESAETSAGEEPKSSDPIKLAFAKSEAYRKAKEAKPNQVAEPANAADGGGDSAQEVKDPVKLAMEKAREYRKNKGTVGGGSKDVALSPGDSGPQKAVEANTKNSRDAKKKASKQEEPSISSIDFIGLNFSDKKQTRGPPPGLAPVIDTFSHVDSSEVEIIVGDPSKFGNRKSADTVTTADDASSNTYKPKVSTWGVFPRPENISKTYGGGRNIRPGEVLETAEVKAAKEARTKELLANYKKEMGLNIDAKTKTVCEKALNDGDHLMDLGKLHEALPYYEKVMKTLVFKSELHGLAALQWSICQDSLSRPKEARVMYEKLQSHPNVQVSKKARQFLFGFQAMEMMKISRSSSSKRTGYESYFDALLEDKANYSPEEEQNEASMKEVFPYLLFLVAPVLFVVLIVLRKGVES